jgi:hypothetical protein
MKKCVRMAQAMALSLLTMLAVALALVLTGGSAHAALPVGNSERGSTAEAPSGQSQGTAPDAPLNDAFAYLLPCNITVSTGQTVTLDLTINTGSHVAIAQQSYLTFTNSLLQVVDPNTGCGNPVTTVQPDTGTLDLVFQNQVDNATGRIAFASGTFGAGGTGTFRVARVTFCSTGNGTATLNWEFTPPRSSGITDENSVRIENQAFYQNCALVNPFPPTATSTAISTNTATRTATSTSTATSIVTSSSTRTSTGTATNTVVNTATSTATKTATSTLQPTSTATPTLISTSTNTAVGATTSTSTRIATSTAISTSTSTATAQSTSTGTRTSTSTAISTSTRTSTTVPSVTGTPTSTAQASSTPVASNTRIATTTSIPTGTSTGTSTPALTNTNTSVPTSTITATATHTAGITATATATATATICAVEFSDVPPGSTFYSYIQCLACRGIVSGYSDGTFRPFNDVTRGQLSKIVSNATGYQEPVSGQSFSDVPPDSTFYEYIERLAVRGIIGGYTDGTFRPGNNATRGQISKIVSNAAGYIEPVSGQSFSDVPPGSTFYDFIERLAARGIIGGYTDGTFRPGNNATRGQVSKIVANTFPADCNLEP